jgi:hypothetical protein
MTQQTPHLWIVATAPGSDGLFAIVSLTSLKGSKDQTFILRSGELAGVSEEQPG